MWLVVAALLIAVSPGVAVADRGGDAVAAAMVEQWTADQVRLWAVGHAPTANMIDSERRALGRACNPRDDKQAAQIGLAQAVLRYAALEDRNKSAGEALTTYYQIVGLESQLNLVRDANETVSALLQMAQNAEELGLAGGDSNQFRRRQLEIQDQQIQAEFGLRKLRKQLARLTGRSEEAAAVALLSDTLDVELVERDRETAIAEAAANRGVMRAVRTLRRCMSEDSLPAARSLLGVLQPGVGLSFAAGAPCSLSLLRSLANLYRQPNSDLAWRRRQAHQLESETYDAISEQVQHALLDREQAIARSELSEAGAELAFDAFNEQTKAVELGQAEVGSDRLDKLTSLQADGELIERLTDVAVAEIAVRQAIGLLAN